MQILDEDMQMVRDWLKEAKAPFHITSHFENLLTQYDKEAARVEELEGQVRDLEENESDAVDKIQTELGELQDKYDEIVGDGMRGALETVKYWLLDGLVHGKPMQIMPREILRTVEDAIR